MTPKAMLEENGLVTIGDVIPPIMLDFLEEMLTRKTAGSQLDHDNIVKSLGHVFSDVVQSVFDIDLEKTKESCIYVANNRMPDPPNHIKYYDVGGIFRLAENDKPKEYAILYNQEGYDLQAGDAMVFSNQTQKPKAKLFKGSEDSYVIDFYVFWNIRSNDGTE
jgi:hypothetical protein